MIIVSRKMCMVCQRSPFVYEDVGRHMSEKTKKYFQAPNTLLMNTLQKVNSVIKFQQNQYKIMQKNVSNMHEHMDDIADRCKETAKICDFLGKNVNSLATNLQHYRGMLQHLNSSFTDYEQNLKYFEDISGIADASGSIDLQHHSSKDNNEELSKANTFPLRNRSFNSILSPNRQSSSKCNAAISKLFIPCFNADDNFSVSCLQSVKKSGNLTAIFDRRDKSNAMKLNQTINISNPYMQYISQKNSHLSTIIDRNFTCSAVAQIKKDEFNMQQLRKKKRSKVPEDMQLSKNAFKLRSITHGFYNVRANSRSHSPPHKSTRSGDN
ncbi:hypothetical protein QQG55_29805 [Brugia pahangi]